MAIIWTENAEYALDEIFDFYQYKSLKVAQKIISDIIDATKLLAVFPQMAAVEPYLADMSKTFRLLVVRNLFKIIYFVDYEQNNVVVVSIWNCRRNPDTMIDEINI